MGDIKVEVFQIPFQSMTSSVFFGTYVYYWQHCGKPLRDGQGVLTFWLRFLQGVDQFSYFQYLLVFQGGFYFFDFVSCSFRGFHVNDGPVLDLERYRDLSGNGQLLARLRS